MNSEMQSLLVRGTAWLSFVCYIVTLYAWLAFPSYWQRTLRWLWSLAAIVFAIHVACAFHFVHRWSHQAAWEATRLQGGYGDGVYLNYLVLIVWLGDVLWWWFVEHSYSRRPRWVGWLLHGFLLFMWFNAAVVFAVGQTAVLGITGFTLLAIALLRRLLTPTSPKR